MNLELITEKTINIAKQAGEFIRNEKQGFSSKNVEIKGKHDFVSYVDKSAERLIVDGLKDVLPEAGFIVEEETVAIDSSKLKWIVDPLDGTTNFIHGLPPYAVSIALVNESELLVGVIYEVSLDECFYAWKGGKSYLNGIEISVTKTNSVSESLIATGFPYYDYKRLSPFLSSLDYFMKESHGMRRLGSAATDLAYVACGRFEAFYEYSLSPWDVAAGALIVKQAGGKVCDFKGGEEYIFGKEIIATNSHVHEEFLSIVKSIFYK